MKKIFFVILCVSMLVTFTACENIFGAGEVEPLSAPGISVTTPEPSTEPEMAKDGEVLVKANGDGVNIRNAPNTDEGTEILGTTIYGDHFPYTENLELDGWYQITYKNEIAYITASYSELVWVEASEVPNVMSEYAYAQDATTPEDDGEDTEDTEGTDDTESSEGE